MQKWYDEHAHWIAVLVGLAVIALVAYSFAYAKGFQNAGRLLTLERALQERTDHAFEVCSNMLSAHDALDCYRTQERELREDHRAEKDVQAQQEMADWAESMLIVSFVMGAASIAATLYGVYYVRKTLERNIYSERPIFAFNRFEIKRRRINNSDVGYGFQIIFVNAGKSPALDVNIRFMVIFDNINDWPQNYRVPLDTAQDQIIGPGSELHSTEKGVLGDMIVATLKSQLDAITAIAVIDYRDPGTSFWSQLRLSYNVKCRASEKEVRSGVEPFEFEFEPMGRAYLLEGGKEQLPFHHSL